MNINLNCGFRMREGNLHAVIDEPSNLIGFPYDRPIVRFWRGKNINTLRLWTKASHCGLF